jgi:hypothetical protein
VVESDANGLFSAPSKLGDVLIGTYPIVNSYFFADNVFTPEFRDYVLYIDIENTSVSGVSFIVQMRQLGATINGSWYYLGGTYATSTGVNAPTNGNAAAYWWWWIGAGGSQQIRARFDIQSPYTATPVGFSCQAFGWRFGTDLLGFSSNGFLLTSSFMDGVVVAPFSGTFNGHGRLYGRRV